ncbi:MAG: hypothetical protein R2804_01585 [Cyclobacteriaceae bacterium]
MKINLPRIELTRQFGTFVAIPPILYMRQLAAIMFSDMTGYTALMQQNELPNWRES